MTSTAWRGRPVLVTGAGGFIASHLVEQLASAGALVRAFLRYNSRHQEGNLKFAEPGLREQLQLIYGDLRDMGAIRDAVQGVDTVFHLGALISIPYSYTNPVEVIDTNVGGTMNVLLAARELRTRRVVLTSTSEVYGTAQYVPMNEQHPLQPQSPYAASKVAADMLGLSFHKSYGAPVTIVRPFNTYGPRQSMRAVIPTIITQALTQDAVKLGALHPTRDFLFVEDTVRAFQAAALHDSTVGEVINFGSGATISIGELAEMIIRIVGRDVAVVEDDHRLRPQASEVQRLQADRSKAAQLLGWSPQVSLEEGLKLTTTWISEHLGEFVPQVYHT